MHVDAVPTVNDVRSVEFYNKTVIVIDVLRATSCIVTALARGCSGIIPVETVNKAMHVHEEDELLAGERFCKKFSGFHFGNSPVELLRADLTGKTIILTTTNGTRAIQKCQKARHILCGSFLNAAECARAALELQRDIVLVCAGTRDRFSLEDSLCAGRIAREIMDQAGDSEVSSNDFAKAMLSAYLHEQGQIGEALIRSENGKKLLKIGYGEDVSFCSQMDVYSIVPILDEGTIRIYGSKTPNRS